MGEAIDVFDTSTGQDLGSIPLTGNFFSLPLNLTEGVNVLRVRATQDGTFADAFITETVDLTPPVSHVNALAATQHTDSFPVSVFSPTRRLPVRRGVRCHVGGAVRLG